jgi:hypothetical protein
MAGFASSRKPEDFEEWREQRDWTARTEGKLSTSAPALTQATKDGNPMTQADRVLSTPPTNTLIDAPLAFGPIQNWQIRLRAGGPNNALFPHSPKPSAGL